MLDLIMLAIVLAFFAATIGLAWLCHALKGGEP